MVGLHQEIWFRLAALSSFAEYMLLHFQLFLIIENNIKCLAVVLNTVLFFVLEAGIP